MALTKFNLNATFTDDTGAPVSEAIVTARLTRPDEDNGEHIAPTTQTWRADANGDVTLSLWPNTRGESDSNYHIRARDPQTGRYVFDGVVVMPAANTDLNSISDLKHDVQAPHQAWQVVESALEAASAVSNPPTFSASSTYNGDGTITITWTRSDGDTSSITTAIAFWRTGSGAPADSLGADGDHYLDTSNGDVYRRDAGTYSVVANITGPQGVQGPQGDPGAVWRSGSGAPADSLGINGDFYLNVSSGDVYEKTSGTYGVVDNLTGPQGNKGDTGDPGAVWREGSGAPADSTGIDGDFYLDTSNGDVYKRASGTYSVVANIEGATGPQGDPGAVWRNGSGAPADSLGINGDFYLDTSSGDVYEKASGVYSVVVNITGPQGAQGPQGNPGAVWREGSGAPADSTGINGDFYLDTSSGDVYKRTSGTYGVVANIEGPTGPAGDDGATWRDGSGAPADSLGINGDYYLDGDTGDVYRKTSGVYSVETNIQGPSGTGAAITLDLGDDGTNESTDLAEIAITGDTNSIATEPASNKLLLNMGANWPAADDVPNTAVNHNATTNYVANEHINHANITISAGSGLSGGGDITANRTLSWNGVPVQNAGTAVTTATGIDFGSNLGVTDNGDGTVTIGGTGSAPVDSVFGRTGAVTAQSGDYSLSQLSDAALPNATAAGQIEVYNATNAQFENTTLTGGTGVTITNADASITVNAAVSSVSGKTGVVSLNSGDVGLGNVPNVDTREVWTTKTVNFTASVRDYYAVDTSGGVVTVTLPVSPNNGDILFLVDPAATWNNNNVTVDGNGSNIEGDATLTLDVDSAHLGLFYDGTEWRIRDADVFGDSGLNSTFLKASNNLSDVNSVSTSKINLNLGNVPNEDATDPANWDQDGAADADQLQWDSANSRWVTFTPSGGGGGDLSTLLVNAIGATSTNQTLDLSANNVFELEPTADITIDTTGLASGARAVGFLHLKNGGAQTLTFGSKITWAGGSVPAFSTESSGFFDIGTASFDKSFDLSGQDSSPQGVTFNSDDTKMYMVGGSNGSVYQYSLTTAGDIGTASFDKSFDLSGQDSSPQGVTFNSDDTKMYMVGFVNDSVYQYSLTTAGDIGTASFDKSFDVSGQDIIPTGVTFNNNDTKMYMVGADNDNIYQYSLAAAGDIGTASFDKSFDISGQDGFPRGVMFNSDDTKMHMVGSSNDNVYQYSLTTAGDIGTASFDKLFDVSGQDSSPTGVMFNSDDTKMYMVGFANDSVYQYSGTKSGIGGGVDVIAMHQHSTGTVAAEITHKKVLV